MSCSLSRNNINHVDVPDIRTQAPTIGSPAHIGTRRQTVLGPQAHPDGKARLLQLYTVEIFKSCSQLDVCTISLCCQLLNQDYQH